MISTNTLEPGKAEPKASPASTLLRDAIRAARAAQVERGDALSEARQEEIGKLELLEEKLKPLISEIPADHNQFDLNIARSNPPRFWVDVVAYVAMSRERTTYDFIKETRAGRKRIVESRDVSVVADAIRDYVAERIVERERALAGDIVDVTPAPAAHPAEVVAVAPQPVIRRGFSGSTVFFAFLLGMIVGAAGLLAYSYVTVAGIASIN